MDPRYKTIQATPVSPALGAEIGGIDIASIVSGPMMSASKNAEASDSSSIVYNTTDSPVVILTTEASPKPRTMCSFLDDHVYLLILGVYF